MFKSKEFVARVYMTKLNRNIFLTWTLIILSELYGERPC